MIINKKITRGLLLSGIQLSHLNTALATSSFSLHFLTQPKAWIAICTETTLHTDFADRKQEIEQGVHRFPTLTGLRKTSGRHLRPALYFVFFFFFRFSLNGRTVVTLSNLCRMGFIIGLSYNVLIASAWGCFADHIVNKCFISRFHWCQPQRSTTPV